MTGKKPWILETPEYEYHHYWTETGILELIDLDINVPQEERLTRWRQIVFVATWEEL